MRVVVIVPGNAATGGVELLYQFVDAANASGVQTFVCNHPFSAGNEIPGTYSGYNCPTIAKDQISSEDVIVLPEVFTYLKSSFKDNRVYLWWMSVDNYFGSKTLYYCAANRFLPWRFKSVGSASFKEEFAGHLCQSQFAIDFLSERGVEDLIVVGDYINREFVVQGSSAKDHVRNDTVVYNPAKGVEQTQKVMNASSRQFAPIQNMTRQQVTDLLMSSKIYIDFGNHPGKDRIPREAAALGCVIITNRRGSAANRIDVPISEDLKFDDTVSGFETSVVSKIDEIINEYEDYSRRFDDYRATIQNEKAKFQADVSSFVNSL